MKRWPALLILFTLLVGAALFAWRSDQSLLQSWSTYEPPQAAALWTPGMPAAERPRALSAHVLLVVISGLRPDAARQMPALEQLRRAGAARTLLVTPPTERDAAWATLLTGSAPYLHGILSDAALRPLPLDTVFDEAKAGSLTTGLAGPAAWTLLLPRSLDLAMTVDDKAGKGGTAGGGNGKDSAQDDLTLQHGITAVQAKTGFVLVNFGGPAAAGAKSGGGSAAYMVAAAEADARLAQLLAAVDLTQTTVIVTGDRGLTGSGGSGGGETDVTHVPLVAVGVGVRPGRYQDARLEDLAPTLTALLGLPTPVQAVGSSLTDMLAYPAPAQALVAAQISAQRQARLLTTIVSGVGGILVPPAAPGTDPAGYLAQVGSQAERARRHQWWLDVRQRLPWAGGIALALLLYLLLLSRQSYGPAAIRGALLYFVLYYALFLGPWSFGPYARQHALTFSLSQMGLPPYLAFLKQRTLEGGAAALLSCLVTGFIAGRKAAALRQEGKTPRPSGGLAGLHWAVAVSALLGLQALVFWATYGGPFHWTLPPVPWLVKQGLDLFQITLLAASSPLWAMAAAVTYSLAARSRITRQQPQAPAPANPVTDPARGGGRPQSLRNPRPQR
ncbi:MAG: alkaline phosphatase family protein [Symbiobacteriia bacterium]